MCLENLESKKYLAQMCEVASYLHCTLAKFENPVHCHTQRGKYPLTGYICYLPAGRSVLGKTVHEALWARPEACGLGPYSRPRAQFFPIRTDLGQQITCLFFSLWKNIFDFLLQQSHTVRVRLMFRSSKPVLFTEVFKRRDSVFADFKLSNKWFTFHGDFCVTKSC